METDQLNSTLDLESFAKDEIKEYPFNFVFPLLGKFRECGKNTTLPPTINHIQGDSMVLNVYYLLEAEAVPDSRFNTSSICQKVLMFQPVGNENFMTEIINSSTLR